MEMCCFSLEILLRERKIQKERDKEGGGEKLKEIKKKKEGRNGEGEEKKERGKEEGRKEDGRKEL